MDYKKLKIAILLIPFFSGCSTHPKQPIQADVMDSEITLSPLSKNDSPDISGLTVKKSGKTLQLVRIMEGGACKNSQQGARGLFKLFASPQDISAIKKQHGTNIFADYELQIQKFSLQALQKTVSTLNFQQTLDNSKNLKQSLAKEISHSFIDLIADDINQFETETKLTIAVVPDLTASSISLHDCNMPHNH